jgi:hypothetical protein
MEAEKTDVIYRHTQNLRQVASLAEPSKLVATVESTIFFFILSGMRLGLLVLRPILTYCTSPG